MPFCEAHGNLLGALVGLSVRQRGRPCFGSVIPALVLGLLAAPPVASAPVPAKVYRLGFLGAASPSGYAPQLAALRQGLRDLGYVEGQNMHIKYRWAGGRTDRLPVLAAELVRLKPDVLVTHGTPGTRAAKAATATIPIVMAVSGDAVATGLIASLARPGGNITGTSWLEPELNTKRLELVREVLPRATRVGVLLNPDNPVSAVMVAATERAAATLGVELLKLEVRGPSEFEAALAELRRGRAELLVVLNDSMLIANARLLADLAAKRRVPAIGFTEFAQGGGLMSYGVNFPDLWRRAATFVDKILKGAKPADLPVEQPTRFEMVLNMKTAKALGITFPPTILIRADQVIQ